MRILFDSKRSEYKTPFGCITPGQDCQLRLQIPVTVGTKAVRIVVERESGERYEEFSMSRGAVEEAYERWDGTVTLPETGLYYYYFRIAGATGTFRLFKYGDDTNMEEGGKWQLSCIPADFTTPDWAKGAVIYQVFPDRFCRSGSCDLTGKTGYYLHEAWEEEVHWQPNEKGEVLNNDFFGGNFRGITEKMDYIASFGTNILYLNPISKSFSSHRYDTGDYKTPDPMLGTEEEFKALCAAAHAHGIRVVLDGVYSHTGADSLYFNRYGTYGDGGAYRDPSSPYRSWYRFQNAPDSYDSWWGFKTLPTVNKLDPSFIRYIITDPDSVVAHWLSLGADGFRLDVADELPDEFIRLLKERIRGIKPDALLMGEVWEDASNKISYDTRRRYFVDGELDSIMNYPFRQAILDFVRGTDDGSRLQETVMTLAENYPAQVLSCNMNLLGTHDTPRILTALVGQGEGSREQLATQRLTAEQRLWAKKRLKMASFLQFTLPGSPSIYYGDEAGMEGGKDPFNRRTYPWGKEDPELLEHFRRLGQLRRLYPALRLGDIYFCKAEGGELHYLRRYGDQMLRLTMNQHTGEYTLKEETHG